MTKETFDQQIERLRVRWKNAFDREFVSLLAVKMNSVINDDFVEIVNLFIGNRPISKPPMIQDFVDAANARAKTTTKKKYVLGEIRPKEIADCWDCGDSGLVRLERLDGHDEWAKWPVGSAPCHCQQGRFVSMNQKYNLGPQFNDLWKKSYKISPAHDKE